MANTDGLFINEINEQPVDGRRLGRKPRASDTRALLLSNFVKVPVAPAPVASGFWTKRQSFPLRSYGNLDMGNCTRAKQAIAATRMERIEQRRTIAIADEEVIRVYRSMSDRLYGGGDNGAYETDALSEWRKPDLTFRDSKGRPQTIDAFLALNPLNQEELRQAIVTAGAHGIAVCFSLPYAWSAQDPALPWDCPADPDRLRQWEWQPNSWGGHSMWCYEYTAVGPIVDHTWNLPPQQVTWRAAARYLDEAHLVIDSVNAWKVQRKLPTKTLSAIAHAVNAVSSYKIPR